MKCPECNRAMKAMTSRNAAGAWKCIYCESEWRELSLTEIKALGESSLDKSSESSIVYLNAVPK